jgi:hypothetical protein
VLEITKKRIAVSENCRWVVVEVKEDDVDRSMDVWAVTTSGEKHQSSNLPLFGTLLKLEGWKN